jgi:GlcNAc-P-P-Und epimerase
MNRVLVTGGGGFIGGHWCAALAEAGAEGIVLDCNAQVAPLPPRWRYVQGDVRDADLVRELCANVSRVAAHHDAGIAPQTYADVNVRGMECVLAGMDAHGLTDLIFTSSVAVYGDAPGATEQTTPHPVNAYGATKLEAEQRVNAWVAKGDGRTAIVLRPAVVIGPGHFANMFSLMKQIDSGLFAHVGAATNVKSLSSARTVVQAGEWLRARGTARHVIANVVSEPQHSSASIIRGISAAFNKQPPKLTIPLGVATMAASVLQTAITGRTTSISAARVRKLFTAETRFEPAVLKAAGFAPADTTDSALREMAAWFLAGGRNQPRQYRIPPTNVTTVRLTEDLAGRS